MIREYTTYGYGAYDPQEEEYLTTTHNGKRFSTDPNAPFVFTASISNSKKRTRFN